MLSGELVDGFSSNLPGIFHSHKLKGLFEFVELDIIFKVTGSLK